MPDQARHDKTPGLPKPGSDKATVAMVHSSLKTIGSNEPGFEKRLGRGQIFCMATWGGKGLAGISLCHPGADLL